ncbi:hypothetical protein Tco_0915081, partial [Tanacetum coccineum]
IAKPLTSLTQKNKKYEWGMEQEEAFQTLKNNLCDAPILSLPDEVQRIENKAKTINPIEKKAFDSKQRSSFAKAKKATISSEIAQWYDDLSSDEQRTVYKGKPGSSSRNAAITKHDKPKSRSKHLSPTKPRTWSTYTTLVVPTKMSPLVINCILGLVAVTTWQQILNKEFGIKRSKEDAGGSSNVRRKGKRKML